MMGGEKMRSLLMHALTIVFFSFFFSFLVCVVLASYFICTCRSSSERI